MLEVQRDFDLLSLPGVTEATPEERNVVQYYCNLPFQDVLNPSRNSKFPKAQVVSLSRSNLAKLGGLPMYHAPYAEAQIAAWFTARTHTVPTVHFHDTSNKFPGDAGTGPVPPKRAVVRKNITFQTSQVDFGAHSGLFEVAPLLLVAMPEVDFGGTGGLFAVAETPTSAECPAFVARTGLSTLGEVTNCSI